MTILRSHKSQIKYGWMRAVDTPSHVSEIAADVIHSIPNPSKVTSPGPVVLRRQTWPRSRRGQAFLPTTPEERAWNHSLEESVGNRERRDKLPKLLQAWVDKWMVEQPCGVTIAGEGYGAGGHRSISGHSLCA